MKGKPLTVRGGCPVAVAPFDDEEDRALELVRQGDDGAFVAAAYHEQPELELEDRLGKARTMGELTEEPAVSVGSLFEGAF